MIPLKISLCTCSLLSKRRTCLQDLPPLHFGGANSGMISPSSVHRPTVREDWNFSPPSFTFLPHFHYTWEEWASMNAFVARLSTVNVLNFNLYGIWAMRYNLFFHRADVMYFGFNSSQGCRTPVGGAKLSSLLGGLEWTHLGDNSECPSTHFIASADGLICTIVKAMRSGTDFDFVVFNWLTGSMKVLPTPASQHSTLTFPFFKIQMAIDNQNPCRYNVMVIKSHLLWDYTDSMVPIEVFDSESGSWKVASSPTNKLLSGLKMVDGDLFNSFYHASSGMMDVLVYYAAEDVWSIVKVPLSCNDPREIEDFRWWATSSFHGAIVGEGQPCWF
ncbi:hypothetical protein L7F22_046289 [Adiantum nelumboides]|nr:hypothetical protein [Adiantum nelumboides]